MKRNTPTSRPARAPLKRTLTLALLLGPLAMVSLARAGALIDIEIAPPEPRVIEIPPPRAGYVWAPGYWAYRGHYHVWVDGHWMRERPGYHWVPDHWVPHEGRYRYEQGRWER